MSRKRLHEITSKLDRIFVFSSKVDDDQVKSHLSRYLCVLTSGYLEEALKIIIGDYVSRKAHKNIANRLTSSTRSLTNLNFEKISSFLGTFSNEWKQEFESQISEEEKDAINSVVANRNQIAHGGNVGVSYVHIKDWYKNTKSVIDKIQRIVDS